MSLTTRHTVPAPPEEVWRWHTRPGAVTRLTPPFLPMRPVREADSLRGGTTVFSLPAGMTWVARHDPAGFIEGGHFRDVCVNPPLAGLTGWTHDHDFSATGSTGTGTGTGTLITDTVRTRLPARLIRPAFAYRQHQLVNDLAFLGRLRHDYPDAATLTFAVTGATGTVGRALCAQLTTAGHSVIRLTRARAARAGFRTWDPQSPSPDLLDGVDVLIHLAGEPLLGRFSDAHKARIRSSRVGPTRLLAQLVADSPRVRTMVSASAIGFYGAHPGDHRLDEGCERGEGFLADVVADWEADTRPAAEAGKRVVTIRTGIVLSGDGGMLPLLSALTSTGLGGPIGDGSMWTSWIALDDLVDVYVHAALDESWHGPVNAVAPTPVTNRRLTRTIGAQLRRPTVVPVPAQAPALLLGRDGARQLALASQRVDPAVLRSRGHRFRYPGLGDALAHELGREDLAG